MSDDLPRLYGDLADWFHLLSAPEEYAEEAAFYWRVLCEASAAPPRTLLELGAGAGCNASHYKRHVQATLVDRSPGMLALSRRINPECEHIVGDMRHLRLGRSFDAVFVHDAICYMTTESDLRCAIETAFMHCRPGGVALFAPDHTRENFVPATDHGGHDGDGRALRYLQWVSDRDPNDSVYEVDFVYVLREGDGPPRVEHERHIEGLFGRAVWLRLLGDAGFEATSRPLELHDLPAGHSDLFVARRPV